MARNPSVSSCWSVSVNVCGPRGDTHTNNDSLGKGSGGGGLHLHYKLDIDYRDYQICGQHEILHMSTHTHITTFVRTPQTI